MDVQQHCKKRDYKVDRQNKGEKDGKQPPPLPRKRQSGKQSLLVFGPPGKRHVTVRNQVRVCGPKQPSRFGDVDASGGGDYRSAAAGESRGEVMLKGALVALITPFRDGPGDETAGQEHIAWQVSQ